jgi:hypothetical protein
MLPPLPGLDWLARSEQRNRAGGSDFFREERLIRQVTAHRLQPVQYLLSQRSLLGLRGLPQVLVQFLRHVLQDQIGHQKTSGVVRFAGNSFSLILSGGANLLNRPCGVHRRFRPRNYLAKTGTLTFARRETTKTITIEVKGDSKREANETFYLDLFGNSPDASGFTQNRGLGTILNDD